MLRAHDGQSMLLAAVDEMQANLARQDLEDAGIPALIESAIEVGAGEYRGALCFNLFVPANALERAREVLKNVGSPADLVPLVKSGALGSQAIETPPAASKAMSIFPLVLLLLAVLVAMGFLMNYFRAT